MSVRSKLQEMKDLLVTQRRWTQGTFARDADHLDTDDRSKAVCFCLLGARKFVFHDQEDFLNGTSSSVEQVLYTHMLTNVPYPFEDVSDFNDRVSLEEIGQFLDKCIETAPEDV